MSERVDGFERRKSRQAIHVHRSVAVAIDGASWVPTTLHNGSPSAARAAEGAGNELNERVRRAIRTTDARKRARRAMREPRAVDGRGTDEEPSTARTPRPTNYERAIPRAHVLKRRASTWRRTTR